MRARIGSWIRRRSGFRTWIRPPAVVWVVALAAVAVLLLFAASAVARPGGGQSYSGGGGGGGGDDGFFLFQIAILIIQICADHPALAAPLIGGVVVVGLVWHYLGPGHKTRSAVEDLEEGAMGNVVRSVDVLKDRDPNITEDGFVLEAARIVVAVQNAWCAGDMRPARRLVSDGVYNRFTAQIAMDGARGVRNMMAESTIERPTIAAVERDAFFDTVHVRIIGRARDADVPVTASPEEAQKAIRKAKLERYVEVWSFLRKPGAQTQQGRSIIEGRCPSCGADQPVGDVVECPFCHTLVNSGEHGWVLAEITQASEWRPSSAGGAIPGLPEMQSVDAGFNRQQVEDRASFLFWKWIEARVTRNPAAIRKLSSSRMSAFIAQEAASGGLGGGSTTLERVAVGAADLVSADPGPEGDVDRALVRIRWSAAYRKKAAPAPSTNVLVLVRKAGVLTRVGLSGDRCQTCGAPTVTATDTPTCDYCGAELASGSQDFVLDEVASPMAVIAPQVGVRAAARIAAATGGAASATAQPQGFAMPMAGMMPMMMPMPMMAPQPPMMAPQPPMMAPRPPVMAPRPQVVAAPPPFAAPVPAAAGIAGAPPASSDSMLPGSSESGAPEPELIPPWALPDMSSPQERAALLFRMAVVAAADGVVTRQERRLIKKCSKRWGIPFSSVEPVLGSGVASVQALQAPEDPQKFLTGLVAAALVDGRVDRRERALLDGVARNMGLSPDVVSGLISAMVEWRNRSAA